MTPVGTAVLALVVLVVGHDVVFAIGHGADAVSDALRDSGHDPYWRWVGLAGLLTVAALLGWGAARWRALGSRLRAATVPGLGRIGHRWRRPPAGAVAWLWLRLFAVALLLFVVQENVEHFFRHAGHLPLLGVLTDLEYRAALPAFALVALVVAVLAASLGARIASLERAVAIVERWAPRPRRDEPALVLDEPPRLRRTNSLATPDLGRAPPFASTI
jgi:hypothetical protein